MRFATLIVSLGLFSGTLFAVGITDGADYIKKEYQAMLKKCPELAGKVKKCKDASDKKACVADVKKECSEESSGNSAEGLEGKAKSLLK